MTDKGHHDVVREVVKVEVDNISYFALEEVEEAQSLSSEAGHVL